MLVASKKEARNAKSETPVMPDAAIPPVYMIKVTQRREITPYVWVHPDGDDRR
jgi:hypothetical protein